MADSGYRYDEFTESWVVIAGARRGLPNDLPPEPAAPAAASARCPFCPGAESETETTVAASTDPSGRWQVRVVRNRYPTVSPEARVDVVAPGGREVAARGIHEVVVEAREHTADLGDYAPAHAAEVARIYRDRLRTLEASVGVRAVSVFRNRGRRAGSSQSHPHGQAIATTVLPEAIGRRHAIARRHGEKTGASLLDAVIERELAAGARIIEANEAFVTLCPFAPHRAYETWVVPRVRAPSFGGLLDPLLGPFARALGRAARRVRSVTREAAYNVIVRTPPVDTWGEAGAAWHVELLPRLGGDAGFELGTGMDVVPVAPEGAANELRAVRLDD